MMFSLGPFLFLAASALAVQVSYDPKYDNRNESLDNVACSTGSNGLETKNFTTFGSLPHFPHIGGASAVTGFNSAGCGTCWALTFKNQTINVRSRPLYLHTTPHPPHASKWLVEFVPFSPDPRHRCRKGVQYCRVDYEPIHRW
jgi:hypothetical protein